MKISKSVLLIFLLILGIGFTSSCRLLNEEYLIAQEASSTMEETTTSTLSLQSEMTEPEANTDVGIGFSSIYYDGLLYKLEDYVGIISEDELSDKLLELGAVKVGNIITETNYRWPSLDLEASRLPVSLPVYYNQAKRVLYTLFSDGTLRSLSPYHGELYQLGDPESDPSEEMTTPTGYSDGGIGFSSIYYNNQLFKLENVIGEFTEEELSSKLQVLGAEEVGVITTVTNHRWPAKDLEASRLSYGTRVFYNEEKNLLYLLFGGEKGTLRTLEPYHGELYDLDPQE